MFFVGERSSLTGIAHQSFSVGAQIYVETLKCQQDLKPSAFLVSFTETDWYEQYHLRGRPGEC
jgi:hypothetical protein